MKITPFCISPQGGKNRKVEKGYFNHGHRVPIAPDSYVILHNYCNIYMHSVSIFTPLLIFPHGGKEYNSFSLFKNASSGAPSPLGEGWEGGFYTLRQRHI